MARSIRKSQRAGAVNSDGGPGPTAGKLGLVDGDHGRGPGRRFGGPGFWREPMRAAGPRSMEARRALRLLSLESQWRRNATATLGLAEYYQGNLDAVSRRPARSAQLGVSLRGPAAAVVAAHEQ